MAKQERSERTLERLVMSAAEQFAEQGFVRATLADVSKSAGVTKGALFFHFSTKDELADAVQARGQDVLETLVEELHDPDVSRLQVLVDVTHSLNALLRENSFIRASVRITRERTHQKPTPLDFYPLWLGVRGSSWTMPGRTGSWGSRWQMCQRGRWSPLLSPASRPSPGWGFPPGCREMAEQSVGPGLAPADRGGLGVADQNHGAARGCPTCRRRALKTDCCIPSHRHMS